MRFYVEFENNNNNNNDNNLFTCIVFVTYADVHMHITDSIIILQCSLYNHYNLYNPDINKHLTFPAVFCILRSNL